MAAKIINMEECGHGGTTMHRIKTNRKTIFLCDRCYAAFLALLADRELVRGMLKATMPEAEVQRMRDERANMQLESDLANTVAAAHAVAGFPQRALLPVPVGG